MTTPESASARSDEGTGAALGEQPERNDPNAGPEPEAVQTEAFSGSFSYDDPERPQWNRTTRLEAVYDYTHADGRYAYSVLKGRRLDGSKTFLRGRRVQGSNDRQEAQRDNELYRFPGLETYRKGTGDEPDLLYRLPEALAAMVERPDETVFMVEGEKDADTCWALGLIATTNANGALNWKAEFNGLFAGRDVAVMVDNDDKGRERAKRLVAELSGIAGTVKAVELPGLPPRGDVTDWLESGKTKGELLAEVAKAQPGAAPRSNGRGVTLDDFRAFMPAHNYIFAPSGESWPSTSVNSRIRPVPLVDRDGQPILDDKGEQKSIPANKWLDEHRPVEQMTWAPGEPQVVSDRLISDGGWITRPGCNVFNLYRPPAPPRGDPDNAGPWLDHIRRVYPNEADHIVNWLAHRVQRPQEKINHALVLGGLQGIGKDTILEPVKVAVGAWNFSEVSPQQIVGRFNSFVKSVILRVSEARDLGDVDRFAFYDHMKTYTAAPPDVLRVDEKHIREHTVFNVCGVIITSNHKSNGIYLPADDRRHYVAWSELTKEDFKDGYWQQLWGWYQGGGIGHVAAYLAQKDISAFQAKAPPPKTEAFWDIVASNSAPEDAELADALDKLGNADAVTLSAVAEASETSFGEWLRDRKNSRRVPHKMEEAGYRPVRNPSAKSGRWKVEGKDVVIYVRKELSTREAITAAEKRVQEGNNVPM
jgi:hypothetical protein